MTKGYRAILVSMFPLVYGIADGLALAQVIPPWVTWLGIPVAIWYGSFLYDSIID